MRIDLNKILQLCVACLATVAALAVPALHGADNQSATIAERIVTIPMPAAPTLIGLEGGVDSLIAMHPESRSAVAEGLLAELFPSALQLPTNVVGRGFMPNIEAVLGLDPDLVVQWGDRGTDLVTPLRSAGLNVATMNYSGLEADVQSWLRLFGQVTGNNARAEQLISLRSDVQQSLAPLQSLPVEEKPRVLYLLRVLSGLQAAGSDTFQSYSIELSGGKNVAADLSGFKPVNREQVLSWNPEVIFLNSFEPDLDTSAILDDPLLSLTSAAQQKRVHKLPIAGYRWDPPSHESPLAWMWMAEQLHAPFGRAELVAEITSLLETLYGPEHGSRIQDRVLGFFAAGRAAGE